MAKLKSTFKNMFLSLFIISVVVAVLLAQVNKMTAKPIAAAKALKLENAIKEVVPEFDNNPVEEAYKMPAADGDSLLVYPAKKGDKVVGFAVNTYSNNGFSGNIQIMVGFDMEDKVVNYAVLSHAETPGLGSKMNEWFRDTTKPNQLVIGRNLSEGNLSVSKDGGQIDAITASTITSRAFLEAVNKAYVVYKGSDADTSATKLNNTDEKQKEEGGKSNE
ncbi:MAG: RnfABCDGE type electron transport complex subunit G [Bacteroidia bacterium]|nr:RnfABCDGE type electron transport complex subunit G [Bacteroidia bacterium]